MLLMIILVWIALSLPISVIVGRILGPVRDRGPSIPRSGRRPVQDRNRVGRPDAVEKHRTPTGEVGGPPARRAAKLILRAEDELQEAGGVIANGYLRLDPQEWVRAVEKRRAALGR